ncbi:growth-regulating factor 10 isoform X1 [Magnolia sinica]|uniref:growth-regulating factor 10 isoform X1 n=1 Tax=Magnolia sinica TaxID=86752 RepID=UPI00265A9FA8|nr:growth-regulating factor 10 isoform X1 [Magnolia sinica]
METQSPPAKIPRSSDAETVTVAATPAPSVGLGLGLGSVFGNGKAAFTFLQLQELEHQALIFKYMMAGVPVPFHLVLPIWKSVVSSAGGVYRHHPSWLGCSNLCFDYRNSMEPEPGRCRRTDGKKWRCSKDVVPDQKYCERHMHRGRQRSRKPVEGNTTANNNTNTTKNTVDSNTNLSISIPGGLELMTSPSTSTIVAPPITTNAHNNNNVSPGLGFSPTSVLQTNTNSCKTEPSF